MPRSWGKRYWGKEWEQLFVSLLLGKKFNELWQSLTTPWLIFVVLGMLLPFGSVLVK